MTVRSVLQSPLALALQGGGAHGAFTWGVLDALLADPRVQVGALSGASAGALNAVLLASGLATGGREGARRTLRGFWSALADVVAPYDFSIASAEGVAVSATWRAMRSWTRFLSPAHFNPAGHNPLRDLLCAHVDFPAVRRAAGPPLFVSATHAGSGRLRLFGRAFIDPDVLMASACLPTLHQPVEVDGAVYWDGGFSANPAVSPLFFDAGAREILLVLLSPSDFGPVPLQVEAIRARLSEMAFLSGFRAEMRLFAQMRDAAETAGWLRGRLERRILETRFHVIDAHEEAGMPEADTRMAPSPVLFERLFALGDARARAWLAAPPPGGTDPHRLC